MELLSNRIIVKYDYEKTKDKVNSFMQQFEEKYYRYLSILPPSIVSHISDIKVQSSCTALSLTEKYVMKKIENEKDYIEYLDLILKIIDNFTEEEQQIFKGIYMLKYTIGSLYQKSEVSDKTFKKIKKSAIIKFALVLNLAVLKV